VSRIFKFSLHPDVQAFSGLTRLLGVGWQGDDLRLWAEYDDDDPTTTVIVVALTGQAPPMDATFLGTAVGPEFVAHVYYRRAEIA
jgi:hypothetical protein